MSTTSEPPFHVIRTNLDGWDRPRCVESGGRLFCTSGQVVVIMNKCVFYLVKNSSIALLPGSIFEIKHRTCNFSAIMLCYTIPFFQAAAEGIAGLYPFYTLHPFIIREEPEAKIIYSVLDLFESLSKDYTRSNIERAKYLLKFFLMGIRDLAKDTDGYNNADFVPFSADEGYFQKFIFLLSSNFKYKKTVESYASSINISSKHLNNICRHATGSTAKSIIDNYIVVQIKNALDFSDSTINEISLNFNFNEPTQLCRFFKRMTGITPLQYRKH